MLKFFIEPVKFIIKLITIHPPPQFLTFTLLCPQIVKSSGYGYAVKNF